MAQKRFRKALKTVMTNREVEKIWETAYTLRSFTGHGGSLFGSERTYGYSPLGVGSSIQPSNAVFDYVILGQLRNPGRLVLAKAWADPADACRPRPQLHLVVDDIMPGRCPLTCLAQVWPVERPPSLQQTSGLRWTTIGDYSGVIP